jgi:hypothetical protein
MSVLLQKLSILLAKRRSIYSVLLGIILLTLPCYIIGAIALAISPGGRASQPMPQITATSLVLAPVTSSSPTPAPRDLPTQFVPATITAKPETNDTAKSSTVPAMTDIPTMVILNSPQDGQVLPPVTRVMGTAMCPSFNFYKLNLWSISSNVCRPCVLPVPGDHTMVNNGLLLQWDTTGVMAGDYGLELIAVCFGTEQNPKPMVNVSIQH